MQQTLLRPLEESSKILAAITAMALRLGRSMSGERMEQLLNDLAPYPVAAIEWALDSWGRNAKTLPALSDLLQLLRTWFVENEPEGRDCSLDDTGYNSNDVMWLVKRISAIRKTHGRKPINDEYITMYKELNATREGGTPAHYRSLPEDWMVQECPF
jgi:hypothetical protein